VVAMIELYRLIDGIELIGRVWSARETKNEYRCTDSPDHAEPEPCADHRVRPQGKERGHLLSSCDEQ
jgi:hypothetical protein